MSLTALVDEDVEVIPRELTGTDTRKKLSGGEVKKVLVVDYDIQYHPFYRALDEIVGRGNVEIVSTIQDALRLIKAQHYTAYVIDPFMQEQDKNDWGLDLVDSIMRKERTYDSVWLLSEHHDLLKDAENKGVKHLYTKKFQEQADGYKNAHKLIRDLRIVLSGGGNIASDAR